jgi:hypothetical protein
MNPCVFTTQFEVWLRAATNRSPNDLICFRSAKRWATGSKLLRRHGSLPILFRQQDDLDPILSCRFVGELVEIQFPEQFESDAQRLTWLDERLWLQRNTIQTDWRSDQFPTWESQFKAWEIDEFMNAKTWFMVRGLREIIPLPLPRLRKLDGDHPLAPNYIRGYALCHYPVDEIRMVSNAEPSV